jgi:ubiquinone/menaquinone biosynthesis C-methylase UbiE
MAKWFTFWRRPVSAPLASQRAEDVPQRGRISLPRDLTEIRRLDLQHFYLRKEMRGNYLAPLSDPAAILDIGCGTGRWAMELALEYPTAQVIGFDITMPTPAQSLGEGVETIPANVRFMQADATQPLPFADASCDFVHVRLLYAVFPAAAWRPLIQEIARVLRPGGWFESLEALPLATKQRTGMRRIIGWYSDVLRIRSCDPLIAVKMPTYLRDAGFEQVTQQEINHSQVLPGQTEQRRRSGITLIENTRGPAVAYGLTTEAAYETAAIEARRELETQQEQSGFNTYVTYGQRPAL